MSAAPDPEAQELVNRFGVTPDEARAIADAFAPLSNITGAIGDIGSAAENLPGTGPKFLGSLVQNFATQVELISSSAETIARAIEFYVLVQQNGVAELFPAPGMVAGQLAEDLGPVLELLLVENGAPPAGSQ